MGRLTTHDGLLKIEVFKPRRLTVDQGDLSRTETLAKPAFALKRMRDDPRDRMDMDYIDALLRTDQGLMLNGLEAVIASITAGFCVSMWTA